MWEFVFTTEVGLLEGVVTWTGREVLFFVSSDGAGTVDRPCWLMGTRSTLLLPVL